ncbi:WD40 repeat-like protein [Suillus hirtellus]|nr:WD40 repeat-like protein [Suillus hirtellus]
MVQNQTPDASYINVQRGDVDRRKRQAILVYVPVPISPGGAWLGSAATRCAQRTDSICTNVLRTASKFEPDRVFSVQSISVQPISIKVMAHEEAESSTSRRQGEALLHSPTYQTSAKDPPPYGAQYRQDTLWEGGNEALPPMWQQFKMSNNKTLYQDDTLVMVSWNRPLPGVRLDNPGYLVPGWEWHISPLGRSYFININTRTTSWKKPKPERPAGSLKPECVIKGHSECIWSLAYLGTSGNIMSASDDSSIRRWKRDGEPVGNPFNNNGGGIISMVVSPDETMAICGSTDGRLRLWNITEVRMIGDPWEGHSSNAPVRCLDWSRDSLEIASGSVDGTIRRWNPDTGQQMAPPIETSHQWVEAVKYSPQGDKFMSGGADDVIRVWSRNGKLLTEIKGHENWVTSLWWSKDGAHIFSASLDTTIRKWRAIDGQELVVFRGHAHDVRSLCLTPDESYIVSVSTDCSIRIWDLKINQAVGDPLLHDDRVFAVAMSSDGKYIASAGPDKKIYVWSLEAVLKNVVDVNGGDTKLKASQRRPAQPRVVRPPFANSRSSAKYDNDFFGSELDHASRRAAPSDSSLSLIHWRRLLGTLRLSAQSIDTPPPSPRESKNWTFNLFPVGNSSRTVEVAPGRKKDRYAIAPPSKAEVEAAMQRANGNQTNSSTQPGQPAAAAQGSQAGAQGSQARPTETHQSTGGRGEVSCEVSCCGFYFSRRSTSRQS